MSTLDDEVATPRSAAGSVHVVRAAIVVGCFLVALILLLGPAGHGVLAPAAPHHPKHKAQPVRKASTTVQIANGTNTQGAAATVTHQLILLGWDALPAESAAVHPADTIVYFARGHQQAARDVAGKLGVPQKHVTLLIRRSGVAGALGDDVVVVLGASTK
jgi:hypothetical protein